MPNRTNAALPSDDVLHRLAGRQASVGPSDNQFSDASHQQNLSRRRFLRHAGASVVAGTALSGCSTFDQGRQPMDEAWSLPLTVRPDSAAFNPFTGTNRTGLELQYEPFAWFDQTTLAWEPMLAADWTVVDGTIELVLANDREWTNGDPVTAGDVTAFLDIATLFNDPLVTHLSGWRARDDSTAVLDLEPSDASARLVYHRVLPRRLTVNRSAFADLLNQAANADSESARETVREQVRTLGREDLPSNGPYTVSEVANDQIRYVISDSHPASEDDARPAVETVHLPSESEQWSAIQNGTIDGHDDLSLSPNQRDSLPDHLDHVSVDGLGGNALFLQYDDEWFGDPRVRRAIAYLLDGTTLAAQVNGVPIEEDGIGSYVGINNAELLRGWFADRSKYPSYAPDRERAETLLTDAGLEKAQGTWTTPEGEPLRAPIKVAASWGVGSVIAQQAANQLRDAGIAAEVVQLGINRFQRHWEAGNYRLAFTTVKLDRWHPYANYYHAYASDLAQTGWRFPQKIKVPMPIGGSEPTTVDARDLVDRLGQAESIDVEQDLIRKLGWVFNRTLPWIPSNKTVYSVLLSNDHWSYPEVSASDEPPASLKRLAPAVALNLPVSGALKQQFESG